MLVQVVAEGSQASLQRRTLVQALRMSPPGPDGPDGARIDFRVVLLTLRLLGHEISTGAWLAATQQALASTRTAAVLGRPEVAAGSLALVPVHAAPPPPAVPAVPPAGGPKRARLGLVETRYEAMDKDTLVSVCKRRDEEIRALRQVVKRSSDAALRARKTKEAAASSTSSTTAAAAADDAFRIEKTGKGQHRFSTRGHEVIHLTMGLVPTSSFGPLPLGCTGQPTD